MKPNKTAKWVVGITGTALSAFILSQLNTTPISNNQSNQQTAYQSEEVSAENINWLEDREQKLANKDWSNFTIEPNTENQTTTDQPVQEQPATDSSVIQPAVQQPINPPTDRNTSRS